MRSLLLAAGACQAAIAFGAIPDRILPGPRPDGSVLLHNQWPIHPVGSEVGLGEFPVSMAVERGGRFAAVLHAGWGPHGVRVVDLRTGKVTASVPIKETFSGIEFTPDGRHLVCGGGGTGVLHVYDFDQGQLGPARDVPVSPGDSHSVIGGLVIAPDGRTVFVSLLFSSRIVRIDLSKGAPLWTAALDPNSGLPAELGPASPIADIAPNDNPVPLSLVEQSDPFGLAYDSSRHRLYASLWGRSDVAVLDSETGRVVSRWQAGLHPNEVILSRDSRRLFVSNGGRNSISVLDTETGALEETLCSAFSASDPPGSTPDSLALSPDGDALYVANAYNNNVACFDVSNRSHGRATGFIPTGWFPTSVRLTPDGRRLLVANGRGVSAMNNPHVPAPGEPRPVREISVKAGPGGPEESFPYIGSLYSGSLQIVDLPRSRDRDSVLRKWTEQADLCRPASPAAAIPVAGNPIPAARGAPTPLRYVIYVIKENRTYDQIFGDMKQGNGDPSLCLFPEPVTPNLHRIADQFVLLDNFYANAEVSASGHEWSMAGYSSEYVEKLWPLNYGHKQGHVPYPAEGGYVAALPALGYLWDRAAAAGVSFRDYGEFVHGKATQASPAVSNLPALRDHVDPFYRGWDLEYSDLNRVARFIAELARFEAAGDMPRLQILRLPNDHTEAAKAGALSPRAMVAQNDAAVGKLVDAVSHSRFWPNTAVFIVEDDAQNGPDHVDAHRTEAIVVSPYVRRHAVDSSPYTTCSMLATIEAILGISPMSEFDAAANPMQASFQAAPDLTAYASVPAQVSLNERNPAKTRAAAASARFNFSREDAIDDQKFNRVIWAAVRGEASVMPAPVHAAFVRPLPAADDDDDDDGF